ARRLAGALVAGIPYLGAAYIVQASFKEPLVGLFVVAWILSLRPVLSRVGDSPLAVLPPAALAAGTFADYSYVGLAWLGASAAAFAAVALWRARRLPRIRASARMAIAPILFAAVLALAVVPQLGKAGALEGAVRATAGGHTTGGNIRAEIPF